MEMKPIDLDMNYIDSDDYSFVLPIEDSDSETDDSEEDVWFTCTTTYRYWTTYQSITIKIIVLLWSIWITGTVISSWSDNHSYLYYRYDSDSESDYNQKRIHYFSIDHHMVNSTYQIKILWPCFHDLLLIFKIKGEFRVKGKVGLRSTFFWTHTK